MDACHGPSNLAAMYHTHHCSIRAATATSSKVLVHPLRLIVNKSRATGAGATEAVLLE